MVSCGWTLKLLSGSKDTHIAAQEIHHFGKNITNLLPLRTPDSFRVEPVESEVFAVRGFEQDTSARERQLDMLLGWDHVHSAQDLSELACGSATAVTTVTHDHGRFPLPLIVKIIDGVLEHGRVTPVVLGADEDEAVVALDLLAPRAGVFVRVLGVVVDLGRDVGFVEEWKVSLREVDYSEGRFERPAVLVSGFDGFQDKVGDLRVGPRFSVAAYHHCDFGDAFGHVRLWDR